MDALDAIKERHSTRSFKPDPIPKDVLEKIVEAGRLAATARNEQPWAFVVITNRGGLKKIGETTDHGKFIAEAAACIAVLCKDTKYYLEDGSAATENMLVAAAALGVQSCWVAGDKKLYAPAICQFLGAPPNFRLVSLVALGYKNETRPGALKRSMEYLLHWEKF